MARGTPQETSHDRLAERSQHPLGPDRLRFLGACGNSRRLRHARRRSLLGDALAHARAGHLPAFMLTGQRSLPWMMTGALLAGLLGAFCVQAITRYSRIKEDAALGMVLTVFFAAGIVLLTFILRAGGQKAGLDKFLFGQAASLVGSDIRVMVICSSLAGLLAIGLYKELKLLCFDPGFADSLGFPSAALTPCLTCSSPGWWSSPAGGGRGADGGHADHPGGRRAFLTDSSTG